MPFSVTSMQTPEELEELRISLEAIRTLLENLAVRGLRACGPDELTQLAGYAEHLERTGAGHLAAVLSDLRSQIEADQRTSAQALLHAQTNVRLLERLLTLRVVRQRYAAAIELLDQADISAIEIDGDREDNADEE